MRLTAAPRIALAILAGVGLVSCNDGPTAMRSLIGAPNRDDAPAGGHVVISQVYGGGGNSGATYANDFIELYNPTAESVSLEGWSVQYASAGSSATSRWTVTPLAGSIAAGSYYLVQEAFGANTALPALPTPNAVGTIAMASGAGKVALLNDLTALVGPQCPLGNNSSIIDYIGYGTGSSGANCFEGSAAAPTLSNSTADLRKNSSVDSDNNGADFTADDPFPRSGPPVIGPLNHLAFSASTVAIAPTTITVVLKDAANQTITDADATYAWSTSDANTVAIQSTNGATATLQGTTIGATATITVSATSNGKTKTSSANFIVTPPMLGHVTIGSGTSPLVIGYQTQMFVDGGSTNQSGEPVGSADVHWTSSDPSILTIDNRGVVTAVHSGSAMLIGTASDGSAGWFVLNTEVPLYRDDERAGHNTEFGTPADGDASNDVIISRDQYTISYNPQRGGPNWVSWDLSSTHLGSRDRCNCYSADTALARLGYGQYMYNTADYTGSGYDRGHMEPSADQTNTDGENARTFFLTNFLPQQHNLNAGPWEQLEGDVRDSVNKGGREAYVIAGGVFTNGVGLGSLKGEGKIYIPDSTWKIVVLMPANEGLGDVTSASDIDVIAVNMPNVADQPTNDWTVYSTSVQAIQRSTGYDFLSALPQAIQDAVENHAPSVSTFPGATILAGETYTATGSFSDLDRDPWTATVSYGDGTATVKLPLNGKSFSVNHVYTSAGTFTTTVTVSDGRATGQGAATVTVQSPAKGIANLEDALATLTGSSLSGAAIIDATTNTTSWQPLNSGELGSLRTKLVSANSQLAAGKSTPAANMVSAFVNELQAMVTSGRVSSTTAQPIVDYALRVVASIRKS